MGEKKKSSGPAPVDPLLERGLPANPAAEQAVLGAILLSPDALYEAAAIVTPDDFSVDSHRRIFAAMVKISERQGAIDYTTLTEELLGSKELEAVGGVSYLSTLTDGLPRGSNIEHYARIVKDKSRLRLLIHAADNIVQEGLDGVSDTVDEFMDRAAATIFELSDVSGRGQPVHVSTIVETNMANMDKKAVDGIRSGFIRLDELTLGMHPGELIIVAARPSMGKTGFAMNIAAHVAQHEKQAVGVFSLEMTKESLVNRMACAEARVDSHKWRAGFLGKEDLRAIADANARIAEMPLYIDDSGGLSLYELQAKAKRLVMRHKIRLLVIDYLQLMSPPKAENRNLEVSMITRGLKLLAKQLELPIVLLCQLNRKTENRGKDHRPLLSDLRDSGSIEQDADVVEFLYREEYYLKMQGREVPEDLVGRAEVIVAKARNGPTGVIHLAFLDRYASFGNVADGFF